MFCNGAQFYRLLQFFHSSTADEMLRVMNVALMHPFTLVVTIRWDSRKCRGQRKSIVENWGKSESFAEDYVEKSEFVCTFTAQYIAKLLLIFGCSGAWPVTEIVKAIIACSICESSASEPKR